MSSGIFNSKHLALDLSFDVGFKKKCEIKNCVTSNGGIISYIVTKKSSYVVVNDTDKIDISSKCRNAVKYGIPIVNLEFLWKSVEAGQILNVEDFVVGGKSKKQDFKSGKISLSRSISEKHSNKNIGVKIYNIKSCNVWKPDDFDIPDFDEDGFEVAKYTVFHHEDIKKNINIFYCVEIHVQPISEDQHYRYRVLTQSHTMSDKQEINVSEEFRFTNISDEAVYIYKYIYDSFISKKYIPQKHNIPRNIGSKKVQRLITEEYVRKEDLSSNIKRLVDYIWLEATGQLEDILTIPITDIKLQQINKVEGVLLEIKKCLTDDDSNKLSSLLSEFYSILPHKTEDKDNIDKRWLSNKQDLCQLIRDMISVTEATNWSIRSSSKAKYKALRCHIQHIDSNNTQFHKVKNHILQSLDNNIKIEIQNIYEVHRPIEDDSFTHKLNPKQLLFHSSRVENFVGLLSRGLLLPKVVVDDHGGKRTDAGLLGSGVYFASSASKSARYSSASTVIGSRFMLVCEVALGNIYKTTEYNTELKQPPEGYNSVHGVSSADSNFYDDEYVIYNTNQQRIQYLVEFIIDGDHNKTLDITDIDNDIHIQPTSLLSQFDNIAIDDIKDIDNPLDKVKPGLISTGSNNPVDLKSVHIKARLLDLAAQVIVLQEYYNTSTDSSIEAKYVFPLDDMAAVCGFEAFINGKHIIGEVKEKEIARKEYKEAISEGHGAYLMDRDEETPDIFTVSVGNLPPGACVLIKITYVAELQVEGEEISFRVPGSVAPWKNNAAINDITQSELDTFDVKQQMSTLQIAVEMPFDIVKLYSPTNKVLIKKTASKAVVRLCDNEQIGDGFQLLIGLNEIHVPRMWVEKTPSDSENRACMLTFYPEFEARENEDCEIIFILDLSNSMTGTGLEDAKKLIFLTLHHLSKKSDFNILVFGTGYEELFTCSVKPTEFNLKTTKQFLKRLCADRGNTELYQPLHSLYLLPPTNTTRNIFLFSDGHINNDDTVLNTASLHSKHSRIFTFSVSSSANVHFLRGLARVSGGSYEYFDRKSKSKWEGKIKDQLNKACQPSLTSVYVEWQQFDDNLPEPVQAPRKITALFNGSRQVVYGFVPNCTLATLKAVIDGEEISTIVSTPDLNITTGQILHRLTARSVIRDWEDGMLSSDKTQHEVIKKNLKEYIINISKEYSLVTQFTSFIAVEKRDDDEKDLQQGRGPQIIELVDQEDVDILSEISWPVTDKLDLLAEIHKEIIDDVNVSLMKLASFEDDDDDDDTDEDDDDWSEEVEEEDSSSETSRVSLDCVIKEFDGDYCEYENLDDVQEKKQLEDEQKFSTAILRPFCINIAMVEEEDSDYVMGFDFFDSDNVALCFENKDLDEMLYDMPEQSASFTRVTAGKSIGGSAQLQTNLLDTGTSNLTTSDVKKQHIYRPGLSQRTGLNKPVNVSELVEETSILDEPKRKSGRKTQTARFSTGGKAPKTMETNDKEDISTFKQQFQAQVTNQAVRDNLNTECDQTKDTDKDSTIPSNKSSDADSALVRSFGSQKGDKNFDGSFLFGNTGTGFGSSDPFVMGAPFGGNSGLLGSSDTQFGYNKSVSSSFAAGTFFGGGSSSATSTGFSFGSSAVPQSTMMSSAPPPLLPKINQFSSSLFDAEGIPSSQPVINMQAKPFASPSFSPTLPEKQSKPSSNKSPRSGYPAFPVCAPAGAPPPPFPHHLPASKQPTAPVDGVRLPPPPPPPPQSSYINQAILPPHTPSQQSLLASIAKGVALSKKAAQSTILHDNHIQTKLPEKKVPPPPPPPMRSSTFIPLPPPPPPPMLSSTFIPLPPPPAPRKTFVPSVILHDLPSSIEQPILPSQTPSIPMLAESTISSEILKRLSEKQQRLDIRLCPPSVTPTSQRSSPLSAKFGEQPSTTILKQKEIKAKPLGRGGRRVRPGLYVEEKSHRLFCCDDNIEDDRPRSRFSGVHGDDQENISRARCSDVRGDDQEYRSRARFSDLRGDDQENRSRARFSDLRGDDQEYRSRARFDVRSDDQDIRSRSRFTDVRGDDQDIRSRSRFTDVRGDDQDIRSRAKTRFNDVSDIGLAVDIEKDVGQPRERKKKKEKCIMEKYDRERKVGIKAVSMYDDMVDIIYDESLTPCKKLRPDLTSYGIGVNIPCIRDNDKTLTMQACNKLITLQSKDGHWNYHDIGIMEIEIWKCVNLLINSGVKSLGEKVSDDILDLLITLIVVLSMIEVAWGQLPESDRKEMIENNYTWKSVIENFTLRSKVLETQDAALLSSVEKGILFYKIMNDKYPLVYYTLELGDDWITIVTKMLGLSLAYC